jgi:CRP/FNR family transcriptional regulator
MTRGPGVDDESGDAPLRMEVSCERCSISNLCLPGGMADADRAALNAIVQRARPLRRGAALFRAGEESDSIYALRTGSLKAFRITASGEEHVTGFYLPGEVVGLESLHNGVHTQTTVALDTALVCRIPLEKYEKLSLRVPAMRRQLLRVVSRELDDVQERFADARHTGAVATVAGFLVNLSQRFGRRGLSAQAFILPMGRGEMANYLGLTLETVSRVLARLQQQEVIAFSGRDLRVLDPDALNKLAHCGLHACPNQ